MFSIAKCNKHKMQTNGKKTWTRKLTKMHSTHIRTQTDFEHSHFQPSVFDQVRTWLITCQQWMKFYWNPTLCAADTTWNRLIVVILCGTSINCNRNLFYRLFVSTSSKHRQNRNVIASVCIFQYYSDYIFVNASQMGFSTTKSFTVFFKGKSKSFRVFQWKF